MKQIYTSMVGVSRATRYLWAPLHSTAGQAFLPQRKAVRFLSLLFILTAANASFASTAYVAVPPPGDCNNPITGKGVVVDLFTGGLAGLLSTTPEYDNVIDGDLTNYAEIGLTNVTGVGTISLISVKDQNNVYPAGRRTGFVIEITNSLAGLLGADVLNSLQIRTYLNNQLRETASVGGGGPAISLNLLSGAGKKRRLDFLTTMSFDEVELVFTGVASSSLLSTFRIFYAYEEVNGCNYNCATALTTSNFPGTTATTNCELFVVTCLNPGFDPVSDVIDPDTTDFASDAMVLLESNWVDISIGGSDIPAGNDVGFVIEQVGLLGLVGLDVLGGIVVTTYNNGVPQETFTASSGLANVGLIGGSLQSISFRTGAAFDRVRITISSVLSLATTYRIYYGFVRFDDDGDGFANCVDKCAGDDNFDADGNGIPDACDVPFCTLDAGLDVNACTSSSSVTLTAAGVGQTWSAVPGNPSPASINSSGQVTGLVNEGTYLFVLTEGTCTDTIAIHFFESIGGTDCNDPIAGSGAIIDNNPGCELCNVPAAANVVDGDLSNSVSYGNLLSLSLLGVQTPLITVKDTLRVYPAGSRVGYAVSFPGGVLSLGLLDAFVLRTYLNDVLVETATTAGNLLGVDALGSGSGVQRIFFEATQPFDEVELVIAGGLVSLDLLSNINIYYAFTEDALNCPGGSSGGAGAANCNIEVLTNAELCGMLNYERSGIEGIACVGCVVDSLSHVVDTDLNNYATIFLTTGALGDVNISVETPKVIPATAEAGFAIAIEGGLLGAGVLSNFTITTYLNGVQREQYDTDNPLVTLTLLSGGTDVSFVGFPTTLSFDEIQLTIDATVASASVLGGVIRVYYGYFSLDSDGDGTPDCRDKCCLGSDFIDIDGDGIPDACDSGPMAIDDVVMLNEDVPTVIDVLDNDDFGANGPGNTAIQIVTPPTQGMVVVNNNGTPNDPTDDTITYTPNADYNGPDSFTYQICDANLDCDTATVNLTVNPVNDAPIAANDTYNVDEDGSLMGNVSTNDTSVDGPMTNITVVTDVMNGTLSLNPDGTFTYTPDPNYNGPDSFVYSFCDGGTPNLCDTATVNISVNAASVILTARVKLQGALLGVTMGNDMRDDLRMLGQVPMLEPYSALPGFTHVNGGGGETPSSAAVVTDDNSSNSIVDWVFVQLRDPMDSTTVLATRSALLQRDGDIVDMDGTSALVFAQSGPGSYYVSVRHRNHLGVMTAAPIALSATPSALLDFTNLATPLYNISAPFDGLEQATVNGEYAMWLGNTNVDTRTIFSGQSNDKNVIFNTIDGAPGNALRLQSFILTAYRETDVTMNGRTIFAGQNNDVNPIFNVVDNHPRNMLKLQSFIIPEQLPQLP